MNAFWNKNVKSFVMLLAFVFLLGTVCNNLVMHSYISRERRELYQSFSGIISEVLEAYPQVSEEKLIQSLTHRKGALDQDSILRQYGIFAQNELYLGQEKQRTLFFACSNIVLLLMAASCFILFLGFWICRGRRLSELSKYMDRVSHGNYDLELKKNSEDELSGLRNELYKLTVSYKEQAERALAGRTALADAVTNISHQLKTPLTSAVILADNLLESPEMDREVRSKFLQEISRQLVGMKWLVVTMLKLSRLDAGVIEFQREKVSLKEIAEGVIQNLDIMAQWREIQFETKLTGAAVTGDSKWLAEALQNVVKNAIEHSPQGGRVEIEIEENEVYSEISVRDYGEGIPDSEQKHLFERFYRASKVENENVGIGLALAKEIVEKMNGSITVTSDSGGTCFMIRLLRLDI